MRYRYTGDDQSRDLAVSGGVIPFPRMQWVDPVKVAEQTGIDPRHLEIVLCGLGEDWQAEGPVKAARTRKRNQAAQEADEAPVEAPVAVDDAPTETPAEPDEESA